MKIYATDFDGTVTNRPIDDALREDIRAWQAAGHLFGIVSGRPYCSIYEAVTVHNIPYDFLIANNGAIITDGNGKPLCVSAFRPEDALALTARFAAEGHTYYRVDVMETYKDHPTVPPFSLSEDGQGLIVDGREWREITEITVNYDSPEEAARLIAEDEAALGGRVHALRYCPTGADWVEGGVDKARAIKRLAAILGVRPEVIYTTGDSFNDLAMLTDPDFEGYAVENALPDVRAAVGRTVPTVRDILAQK